MSVVVWCLPGMDRCRLVMTGEDGTTVARTLFPGDIEAVQAGLAEAQRRIVNTLCTREGHLPLAALDGRCTRCGEVATNEEQHHA